jgi:hypothetical protein
MGEHEKRRGRRLEPLTHPAIVCGGAQLLTVIEELEAGTMPLPDEGAIWREDLPLATRQRLARATGASEEMIAEEMAKDQRLVNQPKHDYDWTNPAGPVEEEDANEPR